jgi:hypothetical protein
MTEDKKGFILYKDLIHTVEKMPDDKAGQLLKHILSYVNDKDPETDDLIIQLTFEPIKQQLKRDFKKYKNKLDGKSNAGKIGNLKRWHNDLFEDYDSGKITLDEALFIAENRKQSHSDNMQSQTITEIALKDTVTDTVTDTVIVKDNVNDILLEKETKKDLFDFKKSCISYGFDKDLIDEWLSIRKTKKAVNTKTAFDQFIKQIQKTNKNKNEILTIIIANSWKGFNAEWLNNNSSNNGKQFTRLTANEQLEKRFAEIDQLHGINQEQDVSKTISERTVFDDFEEIP